MKKYTQELKEEKKRALAVASKSKESILTTKYYFLKTIFNGSCKKC